MMPTHEADETELALLIRDAKQANQTGSAQEKQNALDALERFAQRTFPDLKDIADDAADIIAADTREKAIAMMRDALADISELDAAFKSAKRIADEGQEKLFFPRLASTLGQVETILTILKEQFDGVASQINGLKQGIDLAKVLGLIQSVVTAADTLKQKLGKA
jgi:hypothetical protein